MQLVPPQNFKNVPEVSHMLGCYLTLYYHVINIGLNALPLLWLEHSSHHSLVGGPRVLQAERYHFVMVVSNGSEKSCLFLVVYGRWYLMVSLEGIQKAYLGVACDCIYQLIYPRHRE